jgi:tetratricopeptide (TPR) repeat protein
MKKLCSAVVVCLAVAALPLARVSAADTWFDIKSPNFTVWAEANDGDTRKLAWQLEQMRHVATTLWPWMKVDLPRPVVVIALKEERSMKELAPQYWEVRNGVRPSSLWVSAPNRSYLAIRTDLRTRDDVMVNPHVSAYFSYGNLVITSSFAGTLPPWVSRGLAGLISNTLVRENDVVVGATIPWHLETLRQRRLPLRQMVAVSVNSVELRDNERLRYFDAQAWAFVHYLAFGENGANARKLNAFIDLLKKGEPADAAFASTIGNIDDYERALDSYVNRNLYQAMRVKVDLELDRERFPARAMTPGETALARASFHVAMRRPVEARALIDEAIKADPVAPGPIALEGLLLEAGGNIDGAKIAYGKAVERGTTDAYVLYRFAMLHRRDSAPARLEEIEKSLAKAVEVRPAFASAHAALADVRAELKRPQVSIVTHMQKAVALEPSNPWHRIAAASVLSRLNAFDDARKAAEGAIALAADDEAARAEAERLLAWLKKRAGQ